MDDQLRDYVQRWQAVAERERQELQTAAPELRWRQLNSIFGLAMALGLSLQANDDFEVIQRWAKLKGQTTSCRLINRNIE